MDFREPTGKDSQQTRVLTMKDEIKRTANQIAEYYYKNLNGIKTPIESKQLISSFAEENIYSIIESSNSINTAKQITIDSFVEAVKKMRAAQRQYFKTRDFKYLSRSKEYEKHVDEMTERMSTKQMSLF